MKSSRKFNGYCEKCKKSLCPEHAYSFVDGNNESITYNSPYLCKECYEKEYNTKILNDEERFKNNLVNNLQKIKMYEKIETIRIDKLIEYIKII